MKWIAIVAVAAWLLSPARPSFAADETPGDASHCRALQMLDDARPYIECIDAAREEAIAALIAGTHPDAVPGEKFGGLSYDTDLDTGEITATPPDPPVFQRYENFQGRRQRVAYVFAGEESFLKDADCQPWPPNNCRELRAWNIDGVAFYVAFQRSANGGEWRATLYSYYDESSFLAAWQKIAEGEHTDYKITFPGARRRLGPQPIVRTDGDCLYLSTRNADGLLTEHPRRCV